jgi:hypothetical protein
MAFPTALKSNASDIGRYAFGESHTRKSTFVILGPPSVGVIRKAVFHTTPKILKFLTKVTDFENTRVHGIAKFL